MRRAKTKTLRKLFYTQKVIYIVKPYHLKTCNYSFYSLLGEIVPILPSQTVNNTVVCKIVHKFASVWCKTALGEVGVSLP